MSKHEQLLEAIRTRKGRGVRLGAGIWTADAYVAGVMECVGPGMCQRYFGGAQKSITSLMKEASEKLTYAGEDLVIDEAKLVTATSVPDMQALLGIKELPAHTMMVIKHVLTTPREDRDGDVLETKGAIVDPKMPLLWQHIHTLPIGVLIKQIGNQDKALHMATALLDLNDLTADAAKLVEARALRFSHGFRALDYTERNREDSGKAGFRVKEFEIMEESLVSVPSNVDAEIELYSRGKLKSPVFKAHAKAVSRMRPKQFTGVSLTEQVGDYKKTFRAGTPEELKGLLGLTKVEDTVSKPHKCGCHGKKDEVDQAGVTQSQGEYDTQMDAEVAAEVLGCIGSHQLANGKWRPCESDSVYVQMAGPVASIPDPANLGLELSATPRAKGGKVGMRKMFDVATERLEPSNIEIEWAARFIGCGVKDLSILATSAGGPMRGGFLEAWEQTTKGHEVRDTRNLNVDGTERPPIYESVDIKSDMRKTFLTTGVRFLAGPDGFKYVYRTFESWHGQDFLIYAEDGAKAQGLIDKAWDWLDKNNPLKGEAFALAGGFLSRKGIAWGDVFLEEKAEKSLKRTVRIVNEKGKEAANRGIILAGPPGTGKTLSARVMMNEAKATYIWVSAKDFWVMGQWAYAQAFSLAKALAPSVILYEDIDNYMDRHSVDLIKTEMDGLDQSKGVTTILTTNFPEKLPAALVDRPGRFHDVLELHLPSKAIRLQMLQKWASEATADGIAALAEKTDGLSGAHIYELAHFAKTIKDEDECDMDAALTKAFDKVVEQRELIDQGQLAGSSYRPYRGSVTNVKVGEWMSAEEVRQEFGRLGWHKAEPEPKVGTCKECKAEDVELNKDGLCAKCAKAAAPKGGVKAGRVLSQRNYDRLKEVHDDIEEMHGMDGMPRAAKALCKSCKENVKAVMSEAEKPDPEEPDADDTDKAPVGPQTQFLTPEAALRSFLTTNDSGLLRKAADAIQAILDVHNKDQKAAEYRRLIKTRAANG